MGFPGVLLDADLVLGDWAYPNTEALGLDEFMFWCEDMNLTPMLVLWSGKSYGGIVSGPDLHPYLDEIMNELEVCNEINEINEIKKKKKKNHRIILPSRTSRQPLGKRTRKEWPS